MFGTTRKRALAAFATIGVLAVAGAAYAYFTATGSGTGTATVGTSSALTLHGTTTGTLLPGTTVPVTFTVDNPSSGNQLLGTIHLASVLACKAGISGAACTGGVSNEATGCESLDNGSVADANANNFYMADVVVSKDYGNGNAQAVTQGGTLKLNDLNAVQDTCKSVSLLLSFTS